MLEQETRKHIDKKLQAQGRNITNHNHVAIEYPIKKGSSTLEADYALLDTDGTVLAVIEAKKFSRNARDGEHQAREYAELIAQEQGSIPYVFLSNGKDIHFLDTITDAPLRKVETFFAIDELHRRKELGSLRRPATSQQINADISGRYYQIEAIKKVCEGIDMGKRQFLLVMATGTGKTRTAMGLIDVLSKTYNAQKILFLCDRTALRDQAYDSGFMEYFQDTPKTKIITGETDKTARLYSATYQTMINLLDQYGSGYFDLIIVDEVHRSIYGDWHAILQHFDAIRVGLTATPTQFVDKNTYKIFGCRTEDPTYFYGMDEAVKDGFLVPYGVLMARTKLQIQGIRGREVMEEKRNELIEKGEDPEVFSIEGSDIGKQIDNKDTNRAIVKEFMDKANKIEDGLPAKSIFFAMNQQHAYNLQETFEELYPNLPGFSVVITSSVEKADDILKDFKKLKKEKKKRVAISVDMLDTGVDVPEVSNLVFARKIFSETKFWQMVGRGTRLCPNLYGPGEDKKDFLIIDHALNFDDTDSFKEAAKKPLSLQQKYFEQKIELCKFYDNAQKKTQKNKVAKELLSIVNYIATIENNEILEKQHIIKEIRENNIWDNMGINPYDELLKLTSIIRYYDKYTVNELRFLLKTDKLILLMLQGEDTEDIIKSVAGDINALARNISKVQEKEDLINQSLKAEAWEHAEIPFVETLQREFTSLMKYKRFDKPQQIVLDRDDEIIERRWIEYGEGKKMESDKYRGEFVDELDGLMSSLPAIQKIIQDQEVTTDDIKEIEDLVKQDEFHFSLGNLRRAYGRPTAEFEQLVKVALGKGSMPGREEEVNKIFETFIQDNNFTSNQVRFLILLKSIIIKNKTLTYPDDLYSSTFEGIFGMGAFDKLFGEQEAKKVESFVGMFQL